MMKVEINVEHLLQLAGEDSEFLLIILKDFECDTLTLIDQMQGCVHHEGVDLESLRKLLHQVKGSSGSLGMVSLYEMISKLEAWGEKEWLVKFDWGELSEHLIKSASLCQNALTEQ